MNNPYDDPQAGARLAALFTKADREELDRLRFEKKIREGQADADALRELALYHCPADIAAFAELHRLPTFVEAVWVEAFVAGWRQRVPGLSQKNCPTKDSGASGT